jgi:alkylated DNA repair protein (DNA oxidative demethylase)
MRSNRLGGVPTHLPPRGTHRLGQQAFDIDATITERTSRPLPDVAQIRQWLTPAEQQELADQFREWAEPPAGLRHPRVPAGGLMTVQSVCLGWHWHPYVYSRTADDTDGEPVKPMPSTLVDLSVRAVADVDLPDASGTKPFAPDAAIVNLYAPGARLGLHQDAEEPSTAPVVTISLGDTAVFRMAGTDRRTAPFTDIALRSGDLLVFGGVNRRIYHGVPKVISGTAPQWLDLPPGRLSITVRETGLG